ncbi:MAG: hypothetical protein R2737_14510 [Candidatus Nanopelagicales bacterium]
MPSACSLRPPLRRTAENPFYVALNGQGRARVVVHQAEIPTWFGKVDVVQAPQANDASTGRITRVSLCDGASYVPPKIQGTSIFSAGKRNTLDSEMFQYSSEAKAAAAFAKLRADLYALPDRVVHRVHVLRADHVQLRAGPGGAAVPVRGLWCRRVHVRDRDR